MNSAASEYPQLPSKGSKMSGSAMALRERGIRPTNELYFQHQALLKRLVKRFQQKYGGFLPDLMSEAEEFFLIACKDWDRERDFEKWVKFVVWKTMLEQARKRAIRNATFRREECPDLNILKSKSSFKVEQLLLELSDDARTLVQLALVPKRDHTKEGPNRRRESMVAFLLSQGWTPMRIKRAFREVQKALV